MNVLDTEHIDKHTENSLRAMIECQTSKSINSCFKCKENLLVCDVRKQYVKDIFNSMNPDIENTNNGFEF